MSYVLYLRCVCICIIKLSLPHTHTHIEPTETMCIVTSWDSFTKGINELLSSLQVFTEFTQVNTVTRQILESKYLPKKIIVNGSKAIPHY